jgi:hypothetical protein
MSETAKEIDLNDGVQLILNRMKTNPEEFFGDAGRWNWIFKENLREVMTEIEKAAIFESLKEVRRAEITAKALGTILRIEEEAELKEKGAQGMGGVLGQAYTGQNLAMSTGTVAPATLTAPSRGRLKDLG